MMEMTASERFCAYLSGAPVDRAPVIEWAPWWNLTVERWIADGLPRENAGYEACRRISDWTGASRPVLPPKPLKHHSRPPLDWGSWRMRRTT